MSAFRAASPADRDMKEASGSSEDLSASSFDLPSNDGRQIPCVGADRHFRAETWQRRIALPFGETLETGHMSAPTSDSRGPETADAWGRGLCEVAQLTQRVPSRGITSPRAWHASPLAAPVTLALFRKASTPEYKLCSSALGFHVSRYG